MTHHFESSDFGHMLPVATILLEDRFCATIKQKVSDLRVVTCCAHGSCLGWLSKGQLVNQHCLTISRLASTYEHKYHTSSLVGSFQSGGAITGQKVLTMVVKMASEMPAVS